MGLGLTMFGRERRVPARFAGQRVEERNEGRTPAWSRTLMHDGRTTSLPTSIDVDQSNGSEVTQVEENFDALSSGQKQGPLSFLRLM